MIRPKMFVPRNYSINKGVRINLKQSFVLSADQLVGSVSKYKDKFTESETLVGWDIYVQQNPDEFIEKITKPWRNNR